MLGITLHSKERIIERIENAQTFTEAKRLAKTAYIAGKTINYYQTYPHFAKYLRFKKAQSRSCRIRVYQNYIYIWRGENTPALVTVFPIPNKYIKEMERINNEN